MLDDIKVVEAVGVPAGVGRRGDERVLVTIPTPVLRRVGARLGAAGGAGGLLVELTTAVAERAQPVGEAACERLGSPAAARRQQRAQAAPVGGHPTQKKPPEGRELAMGQFSVSKQSAGANSTKKRSIDFGDMKNVSSLLGKEIIIHLKRLLVEWCNLDGSNTIVIEASIETYCV